MQSATDSRLTRAERDTLMQMERKLRDDQEERWRAYLILRDVIESSGDPPTRRKAALLALQSLGGISKRFGRQGEIEKAQQQLVGRLRK